MCVQWQKSSAKLLAQGLGFLFVRLLASSVFLSPSFGDKESARPEVHERESWRAPKRSSWNWRLLGILYRNATQEAQALDREG